MAFNPATGRAAVALGSCGNCGAKAVQQLTRQLVDSPRVPLPPLPAPPTAAQLEPLLGCYSLQGGLNATLRCEKLHAVFGAIYTFDKNDHFTKTGSGQTSEKLRKRVALFAGSASSRTCRVCLG